MTLSDQIAERAREIHADGYGMSIGEVINLYRDGDLEIHPEFQRFFRWSVYQQSQLIESIFLGIPIPPIFVAQREDGVWDVVDGVQRLSTILQFVGVLRNSEGGPLPPEPLLGTEYLPQLQGVTYTDDTLGTPLHESLRRDFKRSRLEFSIIKKESDPAAKYDLFQRLNSGTHLSQQEARNCLLVMLNSNFFERLSSLADNSHFIETTLLSDRKAEEQYDVELVLRFLVGVLKSPDELLHEMVDVSTYLDRFAMEVAQDPNVDEAGLRYKFEKTFEVLSYSCGENAFRRYDPVKARHLGGFLISAFEVIAIGVARHLDTWILALEDDDVARSLAQRAADLWSNESFRERIGSGIRGSQRMPSTLRLAEDIFA